MDVNLIFHDAVRLLVSQRMINDVVAALETYSAVVSAVPSADTIKERFGRNIDLTTQQFGQFGAHTKEL